MSKSHTVRAAAIMLLFIFFSGCVCQPPPENVISFTVNVTEDGVIELSNNESVLDFGGVPAGSVTERTIGLNGEGNMQLCCEGELSRWTTLRPSHFYLNGCQNVSVCITLPSDIPIGAYESVIVNKV